MGEEDDLLRRARFVLDCIVEGSVQLQVDYMTRLCSSADLFSFVVKLDRTLLGSA